MKTSNATKLYWSLLRKLYSDSFYWSIKLGHKKIRLGNEIIWLFDIISRNYVVILRPWWFTKTKITNNHRLQALAIKITDIFRSISRLFKHSGKLFWKNISFNYLAIFFNSFTTEADIIYKPVHWFPLQINGLGSIWYRPPSWKS